MAKVQSRKPIKKKGFSVENELPQRVNYLILLIGIATILVGYLVMNAGDAVSPLSVTVAPIILVIGYCVIVPLGIIYRKKRPETEKAA